MTNENRLISSSAHTDIEGADRVRRYQGILGWTETSDFNNYVNNNFLLSCNITADDINRSDNIYGKATHILKGKKRRKKPTAH